MAPERDLLGLVDDAHPAPADLADDAIIADLLQSQRIGRRHRLSRSLLVFLDLLDLDHGRK